ncbi:MAG: flagellar basal body-associated FliL family protein [Deltaproteobacteria bacterium]|nr:flagellar basal body-associated FliL family protein [Deltaproteobacteria bacterium]
MATGTENKTEVTLATPKKKGKGMLIGIIVAVVLVLGGGGFFFMKGKSGGGSDEARATVASSHGETKGGGHGGGEEKGNGSLVSLEPFIVNLQDNSGTRYLKLNINLELSSDSSGGELTALAAQIRDSLIILLSSKSYSDIGTVEGKYQLRDEIVARVNQFLGKSKVKTAYFTEFVIQ